MLDVLITGGAVIDGTGAPRRTADVAVRGGRVVAIEGPGTLDEPAARTIDADGLVVAPGVVDLHTHYDAQLFWDPAATPSPLHGVTTVIGGNCGFTIAPLDLAHADYLMRLLARVEGMPLETLAEGVPWNWRTFGEYLDRLDGGVAVNAGFLVGHTPIRRLVMGADDDRASTDDQLKAMVQILHESLDAGGLGFSSSHAPTHNDAKGRPVASRYAGRDELLALCAAVGEHPGTTVEFIPTVGTFTEEHVELMTAMSVAANRPLNWNLLAVTAAARRNHEHQLAASDHAAAHGGRVVALTVPEPVQLRVNFFSGFVLDAIPGWAPFFTLPVDERLHLLADPDGRARLREAAAAPEAASFRFVSRWDKVLVGETFAPGNAGLAGRTIGDIAAERAQEPFDALCDIVVADGLRASLLPPAVGNDDESWRLRAEVWRDPRALIGASDSGAHLDMLDTFTYATSVLGPSVRDRGLLPLEEAVRLLTDAPARLYGLRGRGRLAEGWHADINIFDPDRIGPGPVHTRFDLPAGAGRLYAEAEGIEHVLVNGVEIVRGTQLTGATPGTVLRSGRDTETVTAH